MSFHEEIKKNLNCGVVEDGKYIRTEMGTPQGGVISPLLANIVLNKFDWALEAQDFKFVRYADDFVILTKTSEAAERTFGFFCNHFSCRHMFNIAP